MNDPTVEALKRMNLADFLHRYYGLAFQRLGTTYACSSPFTADNQASFFVRVGEDGHWLFKDYSGGGGGSIFDFVQMKEKLAGFRETKEFVLKLLGLSESQAAQIPVAAVNGSEEVPSAERSYDIQQLYERFRGQDLGPCREYLLRRGIAPALVDALIEEGTVVHNQYGGRSYCCFAVRNDAGQLKCLVNHPIEGTGKFMLGTKTPFSREWQEVKRAKEVFITEGIIDYLSIKSLELEAPPGLALLGNQLIFEPGLLEKTGTIISALDNDRGGDSALLDLKVRYPDKQMRVYDLEGHKDPNELLVAVRSGKERTLSPERKLQLYREFQNAANKAELARHWGIDRSHMYEIVHECEQFVIQGLSGRRPGRPRKGQPTSLEEALARIQELEGQYEQKATEYEQQYCRSEFLGLRLKWAEIEAAELRGEPVNEEQGFASKRHVKKKRRKRR